MELAFLRNQLNPHFLFNTLNNLYGLALEKNENTPDSILKLSLILRYLVYESSLALVSFEKEKEIMHAYIELELLRLSDANNVSFFVTTDKDYSLPPLLWLPVLENIFKHGTRFITSELNIEYRCTAINDKLTIFSKNTFKPGMKQEKNGGGVGLTTLKKRLALLYPAKHSMSTITEGNFYTTNIEIDLI
jgi:LytS/YehU family sensor histidine kinase